MKVSFNIYYFVFLIVHSYIYFILHKIKITVDVVFSFQLCN